ncbi:MAG TPA: FG-GAP-like repeat-containing protein [Terriglobales bacterium]
MSNRAFVIVCLLLLLAALPAVCQKPQPRSASPEAREKKEANAARLNNLGIAYMDQQRVEDAIKQFEKAHELDPEDPVPQLNRAIGLLNQQKTQEAREILEDLTRRDPQDPRVWYNLGLLNRGTGQQEQAVAAFGKAAELVPGDPNVHYFTGDVYMQLQQFDKAISSFQKALAANPLHVSAEFGMARAYQRMGKPEEARQHLQRFQQLMREKLGTPVSQIYGEQGVYSTVEEMKIKPEAAPPVHVQFAAVGAESGLPVQATAAMDAGKNPAAILGAGVCIFDFDGDGRGDIFLANNGGKGPALFHNSGNGRYEDVTRAAGLSSSDAAIGCAAGDYDNDGKPDLAVSYVGRVALYHNDGGKFHDVTQAAGIHVTGSPAGLTFVDYDHDGDLDLYVNMFAPLKANSRQIEIAPDFHATGNRMWRNNNNGTFTDVTDATGLGGKSPSLGAIASDINNDRAVDLVVTNWHEPPTLYSNPREGQFPVSQPWGANAAGAVGASILDFNKDGWMDVVFTHSQSPGISLWRNIDGKKFENVPLPRTNWKRAWGVAALDYDNDGWIDIAAIGETDHGAELRLFRNRGPQGFEDVTQAVGLDKVKLREPRALVAFDYDGDNATDLLITQVDGSVILLRNQGGNQNNSLRLAFKGLADNRSALGTKVEVFAGEEHQKWEVAGSSGYLSQAPAEIIAGLGKQKEADVVRMLWPTGVLQDEIQLASGKSQVINEIDRRGSSCPVLFAWNGERYQLVTDVIGPAVIGHWVGPGERDVPDPDEYVKVDGSLLKPVHGLLSFRFAEPMEEVNYLDQVRLLAIDHPKGTAVYPNERFVSNPPFPEFKVITSRNAHLPLGAWDDAGNNVLPALSQRDHKYVSGFKRMKFAGFAAPHTLELDLGNWDASNPLRLLMHGFTEYFSANSMYAAYQAGVQVVAPYVEALNPEGKWVRVMDDMGFPAGLPRTMVADLTGHLPPGTRRIRIVTNLQIYWDQILVENSAPDTSVRVNDVPIADAGLHFHGYPRSEEKYFPGDLDYRYEEVSMTGPYARHVGQYTKYGDVLPLLTKADDHYVIFGSGEEVMVDFDPSRLPALPAGWERDYFFYANGFVKDMDFYEADSLTVGPMPFHAMENYPYPRGQHYPEDAESVDYELEYNTRYQSGNGVSSYRYEYPQEQSKPKR